MANLQQSELIKLRLASQLNGKVKEFLTSEQIISLAEKKIIPHYIFKNPTTNDETFLFIHGEVNDWFIANCLREEKTHYEQTLVFLAYNPEAFKITPEDSIPLQLTRIKSLCKFPYAEYNICTIPPVVYFLCREGKIVYIGQSNNFSLRIRAHKSDENKKFDEIYFFPCHMNLLNKVESSLIKEFQPEYNIKDVRLVEKTATNDI